jgi:histidine kinase/DNA gyrase B/HSP90-like ATPase
LAANFGRDVLAAEDVEQRAPRVAADVTWRRLDRRDAGHGSKQGVVDAARNEQVGPDGEAQLLGDLKDWKREAISAGQHGVGPIGGREQAACLRTDGVGVEVHREEPVTLSHASTLDFEVRDNGAGFDPAAVTTGHGLLNMRDRLNAIGGHLTIHSRPGDGTQVIASIPLP